ncbi:MAG: phosphocholine cytidylyltransferase family protein [Chloroflexi bacterium]|nr:phosphocholine cytidylyltransferase family protein [Chloroflexota bacterium]
MMKGFILSAGMGTRLDPLTRTCPKCMVHVAGRPMMEYQLDALKRAGVDNCTIVVGYMAESVRGHFGATYRGVSLSYVENKIYAETNNLYSFWLAKAELDDDVLLLEGDLVFDDQLVSQLVRMDEQNVAIVDRFRPHMDGTLILADGGLVKSMVLKSAQGPGFDYGSALKTVNIYRLSRESLVECIIPKMEEFLDEGRSDLYYEAVFANLIGSGRMDMAVMNTGNKKWAEIDTLNDLRDAEKMFAPASTAVS